MSTVHRDEPAESSAESEPDADRSSGVNVGTAERVASAVLGGTLVGVGLSRRSLRGVAMAAAGGGLLARGVRGRSRLYRTLGMNTATSEETAPGATAAAPTVEQSVTVDGSAEDLAEYWRDPEQLSRLLGDAAEVSDAGGDRLRWELEGPFGRSVAWEMRIASDRRGEEIRWQSVNDAMLANEWTVRFDESADGEETKVTLSVRVDPPGGTVGRAVARRLLPESLVGTVLDRFKSLAETGEIPSLEKNSSGRGSGDQI